MLDREADKTFVETLTELLEKRGLTPSQVYKAAGIDRRLYSKLVGDRNYRPSRETALALVFGLRLGLKQAEDLLGRAGYRLSQSDSRDLAIEFFLRESVHDLTVVNTVLEQLSLRLIGY